MSYIKREDAIETLYDVSNKDPKEIFTVAQFRALQNLPAADVREKTHGEWINLLDTGIAIVNYGVINKINPNGNGYADYVVCSNCYKNRHANCGFKSWRKLDAAQMVFCPICGADMRGAENGKE